MGRLGLSEGPVEGGSADAEVGRPPDGVVVADFSAVSAVSIVVVAGGSVVGARYALHSSERALQAVATSRTPAVSATHPVLITTPWSGGGKAEPFHLVEECRIWADVELKPWKVEMFKVSNEPHVEEKLADVVGLYLPSAGPRRGVQLRREDLGAPTPGTHRPRCGDARPVAAAPAGRGTGRCSRHSENSPAGEGLSPP